MPLRKPGLVVKDRKMVNVYTTEEEQVEAIKKWLKQYGLPIVLAIVIGLGGGFGWRYYKRVRLNHIQQASMLFQTMVSRYDTNDAAGGKTVAMQLIGKYASTPYADIASMMLAREQVNQGHLLVALSRLRWVLQHTSNKVFQQIAKNRSARILLAQNQPKKALALLKKVADQTFSAETNEIIGDALLALHKTGAARKAYKIALHALARNSTSRPILQLKYNQLAPSSKINSSVQVINNQV